MAMLRYGHAAVSTPIVAPEKWIDKKVPVGRVKVAKSVIARYDPSMWLLSHVTIIASVDVDLADPKDKKSNYLIIPEHSQFVNNNGDCWERNLLKATYKTFLNADNYCEHVQIPELSKGKVIDVALREVPIAKGPDGKDITTLYVDILIATNKSHVDLIDKIKTGEYNATSMGCLIAYSQCSQCGNIAADEPQLCQHVRYYKNNFFHDQNGIRRIIAELCGRAEDPDSCKFIDASWVRKPAFEGAVLRNIVEPGDDISEKIQTAIAVPSFQPQPGMMLRAAAQEASTLMREIRAADEGDEVESPEADPPKDDTDFPPPGEEADDPLSVDQPGKEETQEEAPSEVGLGLGETPTGDQEGQKQELEIQEPAEDATVKEVEDMMTKHILNKIRRKLLKEEVNERTKPEERPTESEEEERESIVREASVNTLIKKAKECKNPKLINGLMILSNLKNWSDFNKYGYNRNDALAVLSFVDQNLSKNPVDIDTVRVLSRIKTANINPQNLFTEIIVETGKKPNPVQGRKILKWANILSILEKRKKSLIIY